MWEVGLEARWYSDVIACGRWKLGASLWRRKPYVADLVAMAIVRTSRRTWDAESAEAETALGDEGGVGR